MEESKIRLKTTVEQGITSLIEENFPSYDNIYGEIDEVGAKAADDLVESSVKTLFDSLPLDSLAEDGIERYVTDNYGINERAGIFFRIKICT